MEKKKDSKSLDTYSLTKENTKYFTFFQVGMFDFVHNSLCTVFGTMHLLSKININNYVTYDDIYFS